MLDPPPGFNFACFVRASFGGGSRQAGFRRGDAHRSRLTRDGQCTDTIAMTITMRTAVNHQHTMMLLLLLLPRLRGGPQPPRRGRLHGEREGAPPWGPRPLASPLASGVWGAGGPTPGGGPGSSTPGVAGAGRPGAHSGGERGDQGPSGVGGWGPKSQSPGPVHPHGPGRRTEAPEPITVELRSMTINGDDGGQWRPMAVDDGQ